MFWSIVFLILLVPIYHVSPIQELPQNNRSSNLRAYDGKDSSRNRRVATKAVSYIMKQIGWKALTVLRSSARKNIGDGRYKKRGDYETAVKDFLNAHPHNIKEFETPEGVSMMTGRVADSMIVVKSADPSNNGRPIIKLYKTNSNIKQREIYKIFYTRKAKPLDKPDLKNDFKTD